MGALCRQDPCAWDAAKRRDQRKDPERHGTHPEEVADHVFRQTGNEVNDEAEDGALGFDDEAELRPRLWADEGAHVVGANPAPDPEGGHRTDGQPEGGIEEPEPFTEEVAAKDARDLTRDGGDDDLECLERDEDDGRQDSPLAKRRLEKDPVQIEADQELVGGGIGEDEPDAVADDDDGDPSPDEAPASSGGQLAPPVMRKLRFA